MLKTRLLALLWAFLAGLAPLQAAAAALTAPTYTAGGVPVHGLGVFCMNLDGSSCPWGTGGSGGTLSVNASSSPTVITAGTGRGLNVGLFSNLFVTIVDGSGNIVDFTLQSAVQCGTNASPAGCALASKQATLDANGAAAVPETAAPTVTKTALAANTSTAICPTATHPVSTEIYVNAETASIGLGLKGQSLSTDAWGTGSTAADLVLGTVGQVYTAPVAYNSAITARSTAVANLTCVQTLRQ